MSAWEISNDPDPKDRSVAELVGELAEQTRRLARAEVKLAVLQLRRKAKRAGLGVAAVGLAALLGLVGTAALAVGAVLALALVLPGWLAALLVGVAAFAAAGMVALVGRFELRRALPPLPEWSLATVREDLSTIRKGIHT